ncbi:hypothetical protein R3P38DRAFT_2768556 [Favolaschia claudopus]|uniref:DUF6589 domain-containing protein n=1 Tax=Favolaschia claudopus TaxID=2862362 RepID=A0AAW0CQ45_9AGAR
MESTVQYSPTPKPDPERAELKLHGSRAERIQDVLKMLHTARLSPVDLLFEVLEGDLHPYHASMFYANSGAVMTKLLDIMVSDERGGRVFRQWVERRAVQITCEVVAAQMDAMVKALTSAPSLTKLPPDVFRGWTLEKTVEIPARSLAPDVVQILSTALNTEKALAKYTKKENDTALFSIIGQLASRRSEKCTDFAGPMMLYWWKSGCSEEVLEVLQNVGLSKCFDSCLDMVTTVADYCLDDACTEAQDPAGFMGNWDNINMLNSESYEQRSDGPAKIRSGSCGVIYRLCSPNPSAMALEPLLKCADSAPDLEFHRDICPTLDQSLHCYQNFRSYIVRVLLRYNSSERGFKGYDTHSSLQPVSRRPLPKGHVTKQFPVRISTIEENSIAGNLAVHEDIFVTQLGLTHAELSKKAILSINDQATQSFNRGCKAIRAQDLNPFLRAQVFQLGIGLFHLCLNLVWALLHAHRGHETIEGSLSYFFVLLEKTRLGGKHPDYHTLMAALMQILDGLLLDAWRIECGHATLSEFAQANPSPEHLLAIADNILCNHATPERNPSSSPGDNLRENTRRLVHDLLYVAEVTRAISDCDFGRVEDLLGNLAMIFRGAGSTNYCTEILHFIHNLKYVWKGDGFDDLVRDNMIFNMGSGKGQGVDMNLEHNIGKIKQLFAAKGNYADWSRLANISAAIDVLSSMKINIGRSLVIKMSTQARSFGGSPTRQKISDSTPHSLIARLLPHLISYLAEKLPLQQFADVMTPRRIT